MNPKSDKAKEFLKMIQKKNRERYEKKKQDELR